MIVGNQSNIVRTHKTPSPEITKEKHANFSLFYATERNEQKGHDDINE